MNDSLDGVDGVDGVDGDRLLPAPVAAIGGVVYFLVGGLSALIEVLLVPFYIGSVIVPIAVVLAVGLNVVLPRLAYATGGRLAFAWLPVISWVIVVGVLSVANTSRGNVVLPGYGKAQYVAQGLLLLGVLAGFVSAIRIGGAERRAALTAVRPGSSARR
jgi:hypothetical protein